VGILHTVSQKAGTLEIPPIAKKGAAGAAGHAMAATRPTSSSLRQTGQGDLSSV